MKRPSKRQRLEIARTHVPMASTIRLMVSYGAALLLLLHFTPSLIAQTMDSPVRPWCDNVIVPQVSYWSNPHTQNVRVSLVTANVQINEQVATTTLLIDLANSTKSDQRAELVIPVPQGAAIKGFTFDGENEKPTTELLTKEKAKRTFESIVSKLKDPALLEFAGHQLVRSSVFPVPASKSQRVKVVYEHLLTAEGDRIDYTLPRSGSVVYSTPWNINVKVKSKRKINTVYSPTHSIQSDLKDKHHALVNVAENAKTTPGSFKLSYLLENGAVSASLFSYPDADGKGGYFLLLAGTGDQKPQVNAPEIDAPRIKREITLVIDRSGSMNGNKLAQAKEAALQVIAGLETGEAFNILTYSDDVKSLAKKSLVKNANSVQQAREFIENTKARGGTNLYEALQTSLTSAPRKDHLPITLFLTDGLPTVGITSELEIRNLTMKSNPNQHRVFTFGVGYDVNSPLLDKIAVSSKGFSTFVLPEEDVETKVANVFKGLDGPALANPQLRVVNAKGKSTPNRISDLLPNALPDLYQGDQLVLLGRYKGKKPLRFELEGNYQGEEKSFQFEFKLNKSSSSENAFVARLWASRRIGNLVDAIRDMGANQPKVQQAKFNFYQNTNTLTSAPPVDGRMKELIDEIISLSKEFGILTEYTSFLAEEGVNLHDKKQVLDQAADNFTNRAVLTRTGKSSLNQELNNSIQRGQVCLNIGNSYWSADMKRVSITNVQQCNRSAYYRRGNRWISNQLIDENQKEYQADRTVVFGSAEFYDILWELVRKDRQQEIALGGEVLLRLNGESILVTKGKK